MNQKVELLAPAGSPESFYGAIHAGADAVYLAGSRFGARAYADNFTTEELVACIRYAHLWGRRVYLTVNTLVKEDEFSELLPYLTPFYEAGLDGVIIQDIGVFCFVREHFPDLELHVSTQMTITSPYGAELLKKMGAVRIVPARELSLNELKDIKAQTGLEIETFIHGAMCYSYSGQCLFSSILGGRSGNRGRCAQPCRLPYQVENGEYKSGECYPLSLKDMCTIEHIPDFIEAGMDSFKIEGRMKKPEYAAGVTAIYRKYIDKYYAGEDCRVSAKDLEALGKLYIRSDRQDGYYFRHNGKDMVTLDSPSYSSNDESLLNSIREKYLVNSPKIELNFEANFQVDKPAVIRCFCTDNPQITVEIAGEIVSEAMKQPISLENVRKQLGKLGDTTFTANAIQISLDANAFYPLKAINELRRQAVEQIENLIISSYGLCVGRKVSEVQSETHISRSDTKSTGGYHITVRTLDQLYAVTACVLNSENACTITRLYLEADCLADMASGERALDQCRILFEKGCAPIIALPAIIRQRDHDFLNKIWRLYLDYQSIFGGFMVRSMDGLGFLEHNGFQNDATHSIYTDAGFYIWNSEAVAAFSTSTEKNKTHASQIKSICLPYELKAGEQRRLLKTICSDQSAEISVEKVIYGRIPLMLTANCVANTTTGCDRNISGSYEKLCFLTDRYKKKFPVLRNCMHCMNIVYNSLPLSLHGEMTKWQGAVDFRLDFTIEDGHKTGKILEYFMSGAKGDLPYDEYTTGHEKRGAE